MIMHIFSLLFLVLFASCQTSYMSVDKEFVDKNSLASTFVRSPDPAQATPPDGIRLWVSWNYPLSIWQPNSTLYLKVIYGNYEVETFSFPMEDHKGEVSYALLNETYQQKQGVLAYKAEAITSNGEILSSWQHQMWFELLQP